MFINDFTIPKDFLWGAATASYQIEGGWNEDGRGESIWDRFSHTPGNVLNGDNGDTACDHYHRWREDIGFMKDLGIKAYRFSTAWPRILPEGRGRVNQAGLDFYSRLVDGLLEAGILPYLTLYHWDLPQVLEDRGGWPERDTVSAFVEYASVLSRALGDRVKHWATLNEPSVSAFVGYRDGRHAPGRTNTQASYAAAHHLLLAHGESLPVLRQNVPDARIGIVIDVVPAYPASVSAEDQQAAALARAAHHGWFLDPLTGKGYPKAVVENRQLKLGFIQPGDLQTIAAPIDFLGVNYYSRRVVRSEEVSEENNLPVTVFVSDRKTEMGWEIFPQGLCDTLTWLNEKYSFPALYVTENGGAFPDLLDENGGVNDQDRIDYLQSHFQQAASAIEMGVPLKGFFVWSLMDNFEWALGYSKRFGLIYIDYQTMRRIPKASYTWYQNVIKHSLSNSQLKAAYPG